MDPSAQPAADVNMESGCDDDKPLGVLDQINAAVKQESSASSLTQRSVSDIMPPSVVAAPQLDVKPLLAPPIGTAPPDVKPTLIGIEAKPPLQPLQQQQPMQQQQQLVDIKPQSTAELMVSTPQMKGDVYRVQQLCN